MPARNPQFTLYLPRTLLSWQATAPDLPVLEIDGTILMADVSGFTPLVEEKAASGREGSEEVTDILNGVFTELLSVAQEEGGDVLKFGGDAFLLLFEGANHAHRAARAGLDMLDVLEDLAIPGIGISAGMESGSVKLVVAGSRHRELVVLGDAVDGALTTESAAATGELRAGPTAVSLLPVGTADADGVVSVFPEAPPPEQPSVPDGSNLDLADYISPSMRPHLTVSGALGEHRQATIGFIHFSLPDEMDLQVVAETVGMLLDETQEAAAQHDVGFLGTDVSPAGGKIILAAGVPGATRHEEEQVLRTMRRVLDADIPLDMRAGVARGEVFAADLGAPHRRSYTVIGDTVNLAARLMGAAHVGELLATAKVMDESPTQFRSERREPIELKGKSVPIAPYSVGAISGVRHIDAVPGLELIGRDEQIDMFRLAIEHVRRGSGSIMELVGEPGVGKSRLISEARTLAHDLDTFTLVCERYEESTAFVMLAYLLRGVIGHEPDAEPEEVTSRLFEVVTQRAPEVLDRIPLLGIPLRLDIEPTRETSEIDDQFRVARMHATIVEFLRAVVTDPTVFVIEDAQWMDSASREALNNLMAECRDMPWFFVVARRPLGSWRPDERAVVVDLQPLSMDDTRRLVRIASRDHPVSDQEIEQIAERAAGNPLFAVELLRASGQESMPDSIEAVFAERIDHLESRDRQLLRFAAVLGTSFTLDLLAEALPTVAPSAEDTQTWERLSGFLEVSLFGAVQFRSDLIREVAYAGLPYRRRREVHEIVAQALERRARRRPERHAPLLALHHRLAENWQQAWRFSTMAAKQAEARSAAIEATVLYRQSLEAADHLEELPRGDVAAIAESLGDVASLSGRRLDALAGYDRAESAFDSGTVDSIRIVRKRAILERAHGEFATAVGWLEDALVDLDALGDEVARQERIDVMLTLAGTLNRQGEFASCAEWCDRAIAEARSIGHRPAIAHGSFLMILTNLSLGRPDPEDHGREAVEIYEELGDLVGLGNAWNNIGMRSYYRGAWKDAVVEWERSRDARSRAGDAAGAATSLNNLAEVLSDQGLLARAEELFRDALRAYEAAGFRIGIALATSNLGRVAARRGEGGEAARLLESAKAGFDEVGAQAYVIETEFRLAEAAALDGQLETAGAVLASVPDDAEVPGLRSGVHRIRAILQLGAGNREEATAELGLAATAARAADIPYDHALALDLLGQMGQTAAAVHASEILAVLGAENARRYRIALGRVGD